MNDRESKLYKKMKAGMEKVYATEEEKQKNEGITVELISAILEEMPNKIRELEVQGFFVGHHKDIDFEFVNKPEFVDFVKEAVLAIRKRDITKKQMSEEMINVFVYYFREWFNQRD